MPRITYVKSAQARYETKPVLDADGKQKRTPVMRNGVQRTTKTGRPIFMEVTERDLTKPLPNRKCGKCGKEIEVGQPYKHMSPKSGPYGGRKLVRCGDCPVWHVWEYSSSLSARLAEIAHNFSEALADVESEDDVKSALDEAAEAVREIATEKQDGADNMESGFGHETEQSAELREQGESLESWADEIENATFADYPEPEEDECPDCEGGQVKGTGEDAEATECETCGGTGQHTPDEPTEEQIEQWRSDIADDLGIVDESPV